MTKTFNTYTRTAWTLYFYVPYDKSCMVCSSEILFLFGGGGVDNLTDLSLLYVFRLIYKTVFSRTVVPKPNLCAVDGGRGSKPRVRKF